MELADEMLAALKSEGRGLEMICVLEAWKAQGVTRKEAEAALSKLLDEVPDEPKGAGETSDYDLLVEIGFITVNHCQEKYRIWKD